MIGRRDLEAGGLNPAPQLHDIDEPANNAITNKPMNSKYQIILLSVALAAATSANAALTELVQNPTGTTTTTTGTYGFRFKENSGATSFSRVGLYDMGNNGFTSSHTVTLSISGGPTIFTVTFDASTGGTAYDNFRWIDIPVTGATPGGVFTPLQNTWYLLTSTYSSTVDGYLVSASTTATHLANFEVNPTSSQYSVGPNLATVPEPSTYLAGLGAFGLLGLLGWRNRK